MTAAEGEGVGARGQAPGDLWLVRHARPLIEPGICYGATDIPADAASTLSCAQALARVLPENARVFASPLQRCVQLAHTLQVLRPELAYTRDPRLAEMDFGAWEGWRWAEIPKTAIDAWTQDFAHMQFGGRESVQQLMDRVASMRAFSRTFGSPVVWLTHAGVIRAATVLARHLTQLHRADQWPAEGPAFGDWRIL